MGSAERSRAARQSKRELHGNTVGGFVEEKISKFRLFPQGAVRRVDIARGAVRSQTRRDIAFRVRGQVGSVGSSRFHVLQVRRSSYGNRRRVHI